MNLQNELKTMLSERNKGRTDEVNEIMAISAQRLIDEKVGKNALKKGEKFPVFSLKNAVGDIVNIQDYLDKGPIIISFYRGGWCPYCNLELRAYNELIEQIMEAGGNLVAISPELPDSSISLAEKHALKYEVLSDVGNEVAKSAGIVFQLDEALVELSESNGIDFLKTQGNTMHELPLPATYVVSSEGEILLASIDTDYTKRLEPTVALEVLKEQLGK